MAPWGSLPCSQKPATCRYTGPDQSSPHFPDLFHQDPISAGGYTCFKILQVALRVSKFCRWLYAFQNSAGGYTCFKILQVATRVSKFCRWLHVFQNSAGGYTCFRILQVAVRVTGFCRCLYTIFACLTPSQCIRQFMHEPSLIISIVTSVIVVFFANSSSSFFFFGFETICHSQRGTLHRGEQNVTRRSCVGILEGAVPGANADKTDSGGVEVHEWRWMPVRISPTRHEITPSATKQRGCVVFSRNC
jgi:hypothetical protein